MNQAFDVVYTPVWVVGFPEPPSAVLARRVEALDRAHAILWWLRTELDIVIDPVTMFDKSMGDLNGLRTYSPSCGCEVHLSFRMHQLSRLQRMRRAVPAIPIAEIGCSPCEVHEATRSWNGMLRAWVHNPKLSDEFTQGA